MLRSDSVRGINKMAPHVDCYFFDEVPCTKTPVFDEMTNKFYIAFMYIECSN